MDLDFLTLVLLRVENDLSDTYRIERYEYNLLSYSLSNMICWNRVINIRTNETFFISNAGHFISNHESEDTKLLRKAVFGCRTLIPSYLNPASFTLRYYSPFFLYHAAKPACFPKNSQAQGFVLFKPITRLERLRRFALSLPLRARMAFPEPILQSLVLIVSALLALALSAVGLVAVFDIQSHEHF